MTQFGLGSNAAPIAEKIKIIGVHAIIRQVVSTMLLSFHPFVPPRPTPVLPPVPALRTSPGLGIRQYLDTSVSALRPNLHVT